MSYSLDNTHPFATHVSVTSLPAQPDNAIALTLTAQGIDDAIRSAGYETQGVDNGKKGAREFEVIIKEIASTLYTNKELIIALANIAKPILEYLLKKRQEVKQATVPNPTITFIIVNTRKIVEVTDTLTNERLLAELLEIEAKLPSPSSQSPAAAIQIAVPSDSKKRKR